MSTFIKTAKKKQRSVRKDKKCKISISKFDTLETKITLLRESYNIDLVKSISELDDFLTKGQSFLDEYISIFSELKNSVSDDDFEKDYRPKYEKMSKDLSEDMKIVRVLKSKLKDHDVKPTIPNVVPDKQSEPTDIKSVSVYTVRKAENLSQEIILRSDSLSKRYGQTLNILGDYQILEITQNQNLELEFNRILEKMTELSSIVSDDSVGQKMLSDTSKRRDDLSKSKAIFDDNLKDIVITRDITPDKLKNACTIQFDIPKFSGYDSSINFFAFKSKFLKLVEPRVQKTYWAEYLKLNYLSGMALTLVEKENDYTRIWERLKESFGNTRLLLQNKLGELEKIGGLWKVKGDLKVAQTLADLTNTMTELGSLASEHELEGSLYEGVAL